MPWSQMMSMNMSPPRATAERKVESVPNVNARMRKSGSRNIGSAAGRFADAQDETREHRLGNALLGDREHDEADRGAREEHDHPRARPARGAAARRPD